jgi:hypothetical protein
MDLQIPYCLFGPGVNKETSLVWKREKITDEDNRLMFYLLFTVAYFMVKCKRCVSTFKAQLIKLHRQWLGLIQNTEQISASNFGKLFVKII